MFKFVAHPKHLTMKKVYFLILVALAIPFLFAAFAPYKPEKTNSGQYLVIAWNDLGMHCANLDFSNMCILPPYNNQSAHVILKGSEGVLPVVMPASSGIYVTYEIPGNTESATKTNFWNYSQHLFGVILAPNIGLAGFGMTGTLQKADSINYHHVEGIPITAFPDATPTLSTPYQLTLMKAYSASGQLLATTQSVIPISHEIGCVGSGCHPSELSILNAHEQVPGFNIANKPILCANCHADNALGTTGQAGVDPFSQVIHQKHGFINSGTVNDCYKCHPGPNTQCWRDIMHSTGGVITKCQDCHGSVSNVGNTIDNGRNPWLQEPSCGATTCHGPNYSEQPGKLFRQSKGHGGLFCSTCHSSPHAILPSERPEDNVQNINLQGFAGTLSTCLVCHGYTPTGPGPHGFNPLGIQPVSSERPGKTEILPVFPNPVYSRAIVPFNVAEAGKVTLEVIDLSGAVVTTLVNGELKAGAYHAEFFSSKHLSGTYLCVLRAQGSTCSQKMFVVK